MHRPSLIRTCIAGAAALGAGVAVAASAQAGAPTAPEAATSDGWVSTGTGITSGVSGLVTTSRHSDGGYDALIVRDNKKPGENRLAKVTHRPGEKARVRTLDWRGSRTPVDLEALDKVPGHPGSYVAVASEGVGYRFDVADGTAHVRDTFTLPDIGEGDNFENFALTSRGGKLAAVWADRGQDDRPATLYAARVFADEHGGTTFGAVTKRELRVPYPSQDVRHASDLKLGGTGSLLVSAASDPGDDGPFDSAVYNAGKVSFSRSGHVALHLAKDPQLLGKFNSHKIEALACFPNSRQGVLGTDDENAGGALRTARFCER
ncbi:hypothetical protein ACQEU8_07890 [Streptomyces sp. CA-250714]|uniref:hypothetical protein n=1 Tax=Streptomyces sp. CA-250714 TaxID=3240060 RepID=UPI003D937130